MPALARDLLRIVAFIPFYSSNLEKVIDRAWWWADEIYAIVPPGMDVDALTFETSAAPFASEDIIQAAWDDCVKKAHLEVDDYIVVLFPDEVFVDSQTLRPAIRHNFGSCIGVKHMSMHNQTNYRVDWRSGNTIWMVCPYRKDGKWFTAGHGTTRGPNYAFDIPKVEVAAATVLTYQFASPEQREFWGAAYKDPGLTRYVKLAKWEGGGTL